MSRGLNIIKDGQGPILTEGSSVTTHNGKYTKYSIGIEIFGIMSSSEKLCLHWNNFNENITFSFKALRDDKDFTDVTLACEDGENIEVHKTVLVHSSWSF